MTDRPASTQCRFIKMSHTSINDVIVAVDTVRLRRIDMGMPGLS
jgi:hypothetical protein